MRIRTFIGLAPALAVMLATTISAHAGTIFDVPADQPTIQAAINAASNGDRVRVAPGTYHEIIDFLGKFITVHSSDGAAVTIIDASTVPDPGTGVPVVRFSGGEGPDALLQGFTITGGTGDTFIFGPSTVIGGGIVMSNASPTINECIITANTAEFGAGVFVDTGFPTFKNCTFGGNDAGEAGGSLACFFESSPIVTNCILWNNTSGTGTQVHADGESAPWISYSCVEGGWTGTGNVEADPGFVDVLGPDGLPGTGDEDLRPGADSPCVDAGDNTAVPPAPIQPAWTQL